MMLILKILAVVYILAINFYAFMLMKLQKNQTLSQAQPKRRISDGKILLSGTLGGALGVFLSTFILKYRRDSIMIMVLMPILTALTVYIIAMGFISNFWLV